MIATLNLEGAAQRFTAACAIGLIVVGLLPFAAAAQTAAPSAQPWSDDWKFGATIYGFLPTVGGSTKFPAGTGSSISVDSSKIIGALKFAFMGTLDAHKGRWGVFTDVMYMDIGGSKSGTRDLSIAGGALPAGVTADATLDIKGWIWTLAGTYGAISTPEFVLDVVAGARDLAIEQKLAWSFNADVGPFSGPARQGQSTVKLTNWDAIVGVKGRYNLGESRKWFIPYYVDVGTGDSDLTWQGVAGIGYAFKWGDVLATWRYLDYQFKSDSKLEKLDFNGPVIAFAFHF